MFLRFFILALISLSSFAVDTNHCEALPETKRYIQYNFTAPFPKPAKFSCKYKCSIGDNYLTLNAISTKTISSLTDEAHNLVCQGVIVKKTNWGYAFDKTKSFFIHDTKLIELKRAAYENIIGIDDKGSEYLMISLKKTLREVSDSYMIAGQTNTPYSPDFLRASTELKKIITELPNQSSTIDYYLDLILSLNGDFSSRDYSEQLVLNLVKTYANWRMEIR
jgi:hypothetical protein